MALPTPDEFGLIVGAVFAGTVVGGCVIGSVTGYWLGYRHGRRDGFKTGKQSAMLWLTRWPAAAAILMLMIVPLIAQDSPERDFFRREFLGADLLRLGPGPDAHLVAIVTRAASRHGVPTDIAFALVKVESNWNPKLRGRAKEFGLFQIMCPTARALGFAGACGDLYDPAINADWGLRHAGLALRRGSIGYHQAGLYARSISRAYVAKVEAARRAAR